MYTDMNVEDVNILWANKPHMPYYVWNDARNKPHKVQSVHSSWDLFYMILKIYKYCAGYFGT